MQAHNDPRPLVQSMYYLVKDDRKANFNNFDECKYPYFLIFPFFWNR